MTWETYWRERAGVAEDLIYELANAMGHSLDRIIRSSDFSQLNSVHLTSALAYRPIINPDDPITRSWAARAERAELFLDPFAAMVEKYQRHMWSRDLVDTTYLLATWRRSVAERMTALPTGPTLEGNLKSGGITG